MLSLPYLQFYQPKATTNVLFLYMCLLWTLNVMEDRIYEFSCTVLNLHHSDRVWVLPLSHTHPEHILGNRQLGREKMRIPLSPDWQQTAEGCWCFHFTVLGWGEHHLMDYCMDVTCIQPSHVSTLVCIYVYRYFCVCMHTSTSFDGDSIKSNTVRNANTHFQNCPQRWLPMGLTTY